MSRQNNQPRGLIEDQPGDRDESCTSTRLNAVHTWTTESRLDPNLEISPLPSEYRSKRTTAPREQSKCKTRPLHRRKQGTTTSERIPGHRSLDSRRLYWMRAAASRLVRVLVLIRGVVASENEKISPRSPHASSLGIT